MWSGRSGRVAGSSASAVATARCSGRVSSSPSSTDQTISSIVRRKAQPPARSTGTPRCRAVVATTAPACSAVGVDCTWIMIRKPASKAASPRQGFGSMSSHGSRSAATILPRWVSRLTISRSPVGSLNSAHQCATRSLSSGEMCSASAGSGSARRARRPATMSVTSGSSGKPTGVAVGGRRSRRYSPQANATLSAFSGRPSRLGNPGCVSNSVPGRAHSSSSAPLSGSKSSSRTAPSPS